MRLVVRVAKSGALWEPYYLPMIDFILTDFRINMNLAHDVSFINFLLVLIFQAGVLHDIVHTYHPIFKPSKCIGWLAPIPIIHLSVLLIPRSEFDLSHTFAFFAPLAALAVPDPTGSSCG